MGDAQSRQSSRLFLQSSELGPSLHSLTRRRVCPTPFLVRVGGGAQSLAGEGVGGSQFVRGDRHCGTYSRYTCTLWERV